MINAELIQNPGFKDVVEIFIENGMDVNIKGLNGSTPLHVAAENGDLTAIAFNFKHEPYILILIY